MEKCTEHAVKIPLSTINKVSKSICKIFYEVNHKKMNGTGFFMLLRNNLKCLITNNHVISRDLINEEINLELFS